MGFHQKDALEAWGIAQVKAGKLDPKDFDTRIWRTGWSTITKSVRRTPTCPIEIDGFGERELRAQLSEEESCGLAANCLGIITVRT
jgi:hypothetical protein